MRKRINGIFVTSTERLPKAENEIPLNVFDQPSEQRGRLAKSCPKVYKIADSALSQCSRALDCAQSRDVAACKRRRALVNDNAMLRVLIGFLCMCFAMPAHAKLGESAAELIKRFGKPYAIENLKIGQTYKFRSENVSVDATFVDGVSVAETYFSDRPLTTEGEPPNDIVQAVLRTNAPQARWAEIEAGPFGADYALRSSDGKYIATLKYSGPQPENAVWTMTVAAASLLGQLSPPTPAPFSPSARVTPHPYSFGVLVPSPSPGMLDRAIEEARRKQHEAEIAEFTRTIQKNPNDADALAERGFKYSLLGDYAKAIADYEAALKTRPNDHKTELRLGYARTMLASSAVPQIGRAH